MANKYKLLQSIIFSAILTFSLGCKKKSDPVQTAQMYPTCSIAGTWKGSIGHQYNDNIHGDTLISRDTTINIGLSGNDITVNGNLYQYQSIFYSGTTYGVIDDHEVVNLLSECNKVAFITKIKGDLYSGTLYLK